MKKIVPVGEFVLLEEVKIEQKSGEMLLADSAQGDRRFKVVDLGSEADTEIESGDIVFVQDIDLVKIAIDEKTKLFMTKIKNIMGYQEK